MSDIGEDGKVAGLDTVPGNNDSTMTPTKAAFIVGSGHVSLDSNANATGP